MTARDFEWNIQPQICPHCEDFKPAKLIQKKQVLTIGGMRELPPHRIMLPSVEVVVCKECGREIFTELVDDLTLKRFWAIYQLITGMNPIPFFMRK